MIDWLRRKPEDCAVDVGGRRLPVIIRRTRQARRLTMRLGPDGTEVRVTMPHWGRTQDALDFARSRSDWLASQIGRLPQSRSITPGGTLLYRGQDLRIAWEAAAPRRPELTEQGLCLGGPVEGLEARARRWLQAEALRLFSEDMAFFAPRANQPVPPLSLSQAQRRWGSCSASGQVRLNWRLVQAPDAVRRSVVAHEVAHLVHFDHSPAFHALLDSIFDADLRAADRWLKQHGRGLYAMFG